MPAVFGPDRTDPNLISAFDFSLNLCFANSWLGSFRVALELHNMTCHAGCADNFPIIARIACELPINRFMEGGLTPSSVLASAANDAGD